jgi:glutamate-5-semialdehyde dehydrogenase
METLLVHKAIAKRFIPLIIEKYVQNNVEIRGDVKTLEILKTNKKINQSKKIIKKASEKDWSTEYNDLILSIKVVNSVDEAISHINKYGSGHTDAIVTKNKLKALKFINLVDSSSVMWNCSTRFSDGYRYGLGAEVGISTNKVHARGPVGLEGLVIYKYILTGKGHIVAEYSGKKGKKFKHRKIL